MAETVDMDLDLEEFEKLFHKLEGLEKNSEEVLMKSYKLVGRSALKTTKKIAKGIVARNPKKGAKSYHKHFKCSKVWKSGEDHTIKVSVYNNAPHAHLLEWGHKLVKNNKVIGFVDGKYPIKKASNYYEQSSFLNDLEKVVDQTLEKGGFYDL